MDPNTAGLVETWVVTKDRKRTVVEAERLSVRFGALVFTGEEDRLVVAFGPGAWDEVRMLEAADTDVPEGAQVFSRG